MDVKIIMKIRLQQNKRTYSIKFSMATISLFRSIKNQLDVYRGKDFMKMYFKSLRKHTMKIINFKKKKNEIINKRAAGDH